MAGSIRTPEDVINIALVDIGYKRLIGSVYDGSEASNLALNIYSETRDEMLRAEDWGFAERDLGLTLLKTAPVGGYFPPTTWSNAYPILPWIYEYAYPADMLKLRSLRPSPFFLFDFDPKPVTWRIANDSALAQKVILTNLAGAIAVYTGQVTNPQLWEPGFIEALSDTLGKRLAPALADLNAEKMEAAEEEVETQRAIMGLG